MYDFLCLFPHTNASHSLIHYLNQHRLMHVAPYASLSRSMADILAYERNLRPWVKTIGAATKDYHDAAIAEKILAATKRDIVIQTVRDPIESFVAQINSRWFNRRLAELAGDDGTREPIEELIAYAVTHFISPAAAENAYQVDTFRRHVLVDVEDLRGDKTQGTVEALWIEICGDADPANRFSNHFKPLSSRSFSILRTHGRFSCDIGSRQIQIQAVPEGDLLTGYYDAPKDLYVGRETILRTYPDGDTLVPAMRLKGPLHLCVYPLEWHALHPNMRDTVAPRITKIFEAHLRKVNEVFAKAEEAMDFKLESLTPTQAELLKFGIEDDFRTFMRRHPAAAERWTVTRAFLGL